MGKSITMVVNNEVFKTKEALRKRCQAILNHYAVTADVSEEHCRFLASLIERYHPEAELKLGNGVKRIWVGTNEYGGRGFYLERLDGSTTDFSFMKCISHPSVWNDFQSACRNAVADDKQAYKDARFAHARTVACELTGELLTRDTAHVDHIPPRTFQNLLKVFLKRSGIDYRTVGIEPTLDGKEGCWLTDQGFAKRWREFHSVNARLRLISRTANLSNSKRDAAAIERIIKERSRLDMAV